MILFTSVSLILGISTILASATALPQTTYCVDGALGCQGPSIVVSDKKNSTEVEASYKNLRRCVEMVTLTHTSIVELDMCVGKRQVG